MTKLWGDGVPALVRDCYSLRLCHFYTTLLQPPPASPVSTVFWISVPPPPRTELLLLPHLSPFNAAYLSLCTRLSPPTRPDVERPSTWAAPPPAGLHRSSALPSLAGGHKELPAQAYDCRPSFGCPPFAVLDPRLGPCQTQGFSRPRVGPFLPLPPSVARMSAPPPAGLNRRPSPLPVPRGLRCVLLSPVPCASASPSPCSVPSLGVFWSLISLRMSFCARSRGQGASTPWQLLAQDLAPTLLGHAVAIQATPPPPPVPVPVPPP